MMTILIVHAHEHPDSFSSALATTAEQHFSQKGHQVNISDLYQKRFNPVAGKFDFTRLSDADYYKYALEQLYANQHELFAPDVKAEMDLLEAADLLIFNFPLWWFDLPAILKGWVDRVLSYGFAYGGNYGLYEAGRFKDKKALLCITTGSPASFYTLEGMHHRTLPDILRNVQEGILGLVGFEVLEPFVAYSVARISQKDRSQILVDYKKYLDKALK